MFFLFLVAYAVIAMGVTVYKRAKARQYFVSHPDLPSALTESRYYRKVAQGVTVPQVLSLLAHVALVMYAVLFFDTLGQNPDGNVIAGLVLLPLTFVTAIVNAFWIFPSSLNHAVQYAYRYKKTSVLVKIEEVFAWLVWLFYTGYAIWLVIAFGV